ncbi:MAG TPA: hypothetical protein VF982_07590 [Anaerolineales bacterium]
MVKRQLVFARVKLPWKARGENRCPICDEIIVGEGVERHGKRFCRSWHADFYRPSPPWWRRLRWPDDEAGGGGGGCCG